MNCKAYYSKELNFSLLKINNICKTIEDLTAIIAATPAVSWAWQWEGLPRGTGFESMKGSWRGAEAWHYVRPGAAESVASIAVEIPALKGTWKESVA